jgi:hypothetical protein
MLRADVATLKGAHAWLLGSCIGGRHMVSMTST